MKEVELFQFIGLFLIIILVFLKDCMIPLITMVTILIRSPKTGTKMKRFFRNVKILQKEQPDEKISIQLGTDCVRTKAS
jgi:hypothetical protein